MNASIVFRRALVLSLVLAAVIAVVGGVVSGLIVGQDGVLSVLVGRNPDAIARTSPGHAGTTTEFKTLVGLDSGSVKANIRQGLRQVRAHEDNRVVLDGGTGGLVHEPLWIPVVNVLAWTLILALVATWLVRRGRRRA